MLQLKKKLQNSATKSKEQSELYIGIDVHKKQWNITVLGKKEQLLVGKTIKPEPIVMIKTLQNRYNYKKAYAVYEAGYCGFWIQRELTKMGIETKVVNPADIPTSDKEHKFKTDARDSHKLAKALRADMLTGIYIPTQEEEWNQTVIRKRAKLVIKRSSIKNQIKGFISKHNLPIQEYRGGKWSLAHIATLQEYGNKPGILNSNIKGLVEDLCYYNERIKQVDAELLSIGNSDKYKEDYQNLLSCPGIGPVIAITILLELYNIERFEKIQNFMSFLGLVPTEHSSGNSKHTGHMSRRCKGHLKSLLIEASWIAIGRDEILGKYYKKQKHFKDGQKAIIKTAHKLGARIYHILKTKESYKFNYGGAA